MAIIKCPECGRQISDKAPTCPSCGVEIAGKITKCPHCGEVYFSSQEMCPNCHEIAVGVTHPVASSAAVKDQTPVALSVSGIFSSFRDSFDFSSSISYSSDCPSNPSRPHQYLLYVVLVLLRAEMTAERAILLRNHEEKGHPLYLHHLIHLCCLGMWHYVLLLRQCQSQQGDGSL